MGNNMSNNKEYVNIEIKRDDKRNIIEVHARGDIRQGDTSGVLLGALIDDLRKSVDELNESSNRLEKLTVWIKYLTIGMFILTIILCMLTIYLIILTSKL